MRTSPWSRVIALLGALLVLACVAKAQRRGGPHLPGGLALGSLCSSAETIGNGLGAIEVIAKPTAEQQAALDELKSIARLNADAMKPACAGGYPATLPDRIAASERRLAATLAGIRKLQPALNKFYDRLDDRRKGEVDGLLILPGV
jgi:hypothetical protein